MDLQNINPLKIKYWDDLILSSTNHSFFHSSAWAKVLVDTYRFNPVYFTSFNDFKVNSLFPFMEVANFFGQRRAISLPFSDYCFPICTTPVIPENNIDYIIQFGKNNGWHSIEFRGLNFDTNMQSSSFCYRHTLELLTDSQELFSRFRKGTKSSIKKAQKEGVKIELSNSIEALVKYYKLHCTTRKKHGVPPQSFYFFKSIYYNILLKNLGFVALAIYKQHVVAGAVFFSFGKEIIYKYSASIIQFNHLSPTNLILWETIKWGFANGYKNICFGKTESENLGLRRFKNGWNTKEEIIYYHIYDINKKKFIIDERELKKYQIIIFRNLPTFLLKAIGTFLYKYKP